MTNSALSKSKPDVFQAITEKIVAAIEAGAGTFQMPWHGGLVPPTFPVNAATENPYHGVNVVALWVEAHVRRYISGYWASYRQWQGIGAQVRKGESGALIVFYKPIEGEDGETSEDTEKRARFVVRASHVFNSEQVDGWQPTWPEPKSDAQAAAEIAALVADLEISIRHGAHMACYRRNLDCIDMPRPEDFIGTSTSTPTESYNAVLCHEAVHWSGAPHRLNREFGERFGDKAYAFEELIAELGAAFMCSIYGIANEPRLDHASYISSWLAVLSQDSRAIFTAASKAQEAVEYLRYRDPVPSST